MSGDHLERLAGYVIHLEETVAKYGAGADEYVVTLNLNHDEGGTRDALHLADLRAALDELARLRAQHLLALGNAYAVGWTDAIGAIRTPGWAEREAGWKRFLGEADADPEAYAKAKFAADMDRLRKTDPGGAQWVEQILSERTELPDRQAKLLAAIQREGGEWAPIRAQSVLVQAGYALTKERAHQIMKQLAARGYLEPVRPRAYTYRLKTEAAQQPKPDRSGT